MRQGNQNARAREVCMATVSLLHNITQNLTHCKPDNFPDVSCACTLQVTVRTVPHCFRPQPSTQTLRWRERDRDERERESVRAGVV